MDGPVPLFERDVMLYDRLVMLAFAEHLAFAQANQKPRAKTKAS
jgi:hypothetical protein